MNAARLLRLAVAEAASMRGRRLWWSVVVAAVGSSVGGLAMAGLVLPFDDVSAVEASTVVVSRGSSTAVAVAVLASLAAAPYRDGSWMHAALAVPSPVPRLVASAGPTVVLGVAVGAVGVAAAATAAALVDPSALAALPVAAAAHLGLAAVWTTWMLALAHVTRSPLATLVIGAGLPLVVEPGIAGLLAQTALAELRWALPATALRSLAELPASPGVLLDGATIEQAPLLVGAALGWTCAATTAAWARARGTQPR